MGARAQDAQRGKDAGLEQLFFGWEHRSPNRDLDGPRAHNDACLSTGPESGDEAASNVPWMPPTSPGAQRRNR